MNILIFENEIVEVENAFKMLNILYYKSKLVYRYETSSQDVKVEEYKTFDLIFIDIDLSVKSEKDGFGILNDIKKHNTEILKKVVVLTGSNLMRKKLDSDGYKDVPLIQKPVDYKDINKLMKEKLNQLSKNNKPDS